jgi:hypothetical protein
MEPPAQCQAHCSCSINVSYCYCCLCKWERGVFKGKMEPSVPAGFRGHSSQPAVSLPLPSTFLMPVYICVSLSWLCLLPSCPLQHTQTHLLSICVIPSYLAATLGPSSNTTPWEQQSMGRNSLPDRWTQGGWAASVELPRKPETGAELP